MAGRAVEIRVVDHGMNRASALLKQPRKKLMVGVLPDQAAQHHSRGRTIGEVAMWLEYGVPLEDGSHSPARSWLHDWLDENINEITRQLATDTLRVLFGKPPEDEKFALEKRGLMYRHQIVDRIEQIPGSGRVLEGSTIKRKGGLDTPLIDTETFINAIRYKVEQGMDLAAIQTGIESWLNITAVDVDNGLAPLPVEFGRSPSLIHTKPYVLVYRGPIVKIGHDVPQYTFDDLTDAYTEKMWGVREMTVRLRFITFNQTWGKDARQYAEDWRIRAESTRSIEELGGTAYLALVETGELVDLDYEWSGRLVSMVQSSIRLRLWGYERSPSTDQGYIWTVNAEAQNQLTDSQGNPIYDLKNNPVIGLGVREISITGSLEP